MIFETQRLIIRELSGKDLDGFHDLQRNPRVMRYTSGEATDSLADNQAELDQLIGFYSRPDNNFWVWAVESKTDSFFVGTTALITNEEGEHEIGFRLREQCWGNGYGREIAGQLIRYAFDVLLLETLVAYVFTANEASAKILDRYMQLEKEFYNEEAQCLDRKYLLTIENYRKQNASAH